MKHKFLLIVLISIGLISCKSRYQITSVSGKIVEMSASLDDKPHAKMQSLVSKYKTLLDEEMSEVIGTSTQLMDYHLPESLLTNFTSDVMKAYGDEHIPGGADVAVMNLNGHRANMPEGPITVGNMYEIYSFDNTITFLDLKGSELNKIFKAYARMGGSGISKNVKLVIENRKIKSATIDGNPIDENKIYKIVTLDYLAEGNNGMDAFKNAQETINSGITLRDIMIDYVREQTRRGQQISSVLDGRITVTK